MGLVGAYMAENAFKEIRIMVEGPLELRLEDFKSNYLFLYHSLNAAERSYFRRTVWGTLNWNPSLSPWDPIKYLNHMRKLIHNMTEANTDLYNMVIPFLRTFDDFFSDLKKKMTIQRNIQPFIMAFWGFQISLPCSLLLFRYLRMRVYGYRLPTCMLLIFSWMAAAVFAPLAVGVSDFCMDPTFNFYHRSPFLKGLKDEVVKYYISCKGGKAVDFLYSWEMAFLQNKTFELYYYCNTSLIYYSRGHRHNIYRVDYRPNIEAMWEDLTNMKDQFAKLRMCTETRQMFRIITKFLCDDGLFGLTMQVIGTIGGGILLTLVLMTLCQIRFLMYTVR
ncbi:uncharacterized protein LOC113233888 [Hyposmocoma kahamanoa]|uniref:uncharacterized protein LOC113233888 n=1 Tax=Hyposmocoma kahamanoa TaxID=1477025 RepID=UPI000E6D6655|nr:uncharacterized protein LOC113233888 [Hyposmocoma kahamanoa]